MGLQGNARFGSPARPVGSWLVALGLVGMVAAGSGVARSCPGAPPEGGHPVQSGTLRTVGQEGPWRDPAALARRLFQAADGFIRHQGGSVQIWAADRDWFLEEWGRDTFIALPGLLLATGRLPEAMANIRGFARYEHEGLIPNRVGDVSRWTPQDPEGAEYNTSDAPLWFIQAVRCTAGVRGNQAFAAEMAPVVRRIMEKYRTGTGYRRYNRFNRIGMDSDGLVVTPAQSTWMDADPDGLDRPVTPRNGKAVEINALWYANLRFLADLERRLGRPQDAKAWQVLADRVRDSFSRRFWFQPSPGCGALRDVVDGDPFGDDIRPNMLLAVSLGGDLLSPEQQAAVVLTATRELLTPYGMRTLSHRSPRYCPRYDTSQPPILKDQAYHQGTAWPWLLGPYADALVRVRRQQGWPEPRIQSELRALLRPLLEDMAAHPDGTIPEVYDGGDPSESLRDFSLEDPTGLARALAGKSGQKRGGTRSQAWSVGEVLRVAVQYGLIPTGTGDSGDLGGCRWLEVPGN